MPNHVTNVVSVSDLGGSDLASVHSALLNDERQVDFNVIKPMPDCLRDFSPNSGILSRASMALGLLDEPVQDASSISELTSNMAFSNAMREATKPPREEDAVNIVRAIENHRKCGYLYWYDWSVEHWETKWNAYDQPEHGYDRTADSFRFQTAWSHPSALITHLSKTCPSVVFDIGYADEDLGSNCGTYTLKNGRRSDETIAPNFNSQTPDEQAKFTKLAFGICYADEDPASQGYDENWRYSEDVYDAFHAKAS